MLLDTHLFIWWDAGRQTLNRNVLTAIAEPQNRALFSAVAVWEISIKRRVGKLNFSGTVVDAIARNGFFELPILAAEAEAAGGLAWDHVDPFDRLLVAQASHRRMTLVTADGAIRAYGGASILWAGR